MKFLQFTPFVRIALALLIGVSCGFVGVAVAFVALVPLKEFRIYFAIILCGFFLTQIDHHFKTIPKPYGNQALMVVQEEAGIYYKCSLLEVDNFPLKFPVSTIVDVNKSIVPSLSPLDTIRGNIFVESLSGYKIAPKSLLARERRMGYGEMVSFYDDTIVVTPSEANSSTVASIKGYAERFRGLILQKIDSMELSKEHHGLLKAIMVGDKESLMMKTRQRYSRAGASHILAISGFHISVILLILNLLFWWTRKIKFLSLAKDLFIIILLWFFALMSGFEPSVIRAVVMCTILQLSAFAIISKFQLFNTLAFVFVVMVAFDVSLIWNIGFQLSFLATAVILSLLQCLPRYKNSSLWSKILSFFTFPFLVSLVITLFIMPLTLYSFGSMSLLAPISNLFLVPLMPILYILVVVAILSGAPFLEGLIGWILAFIDNILNFFNSFQWLWVEEFNFSLLDLIISYLIISLVILLRFYRSKKSSKIEKSELP